MVLAGDLIVKHRGHYFVPRFEPFLMRVIILLVDTYILSLHEPFESLSGSMVDELCSLCSVVLSRFGWAGEWRTTV